MLSVEKSRQMASPGTAKTVFWSGRFAAQGGFLYYVAWLSSWFGEWLGVTPPFYLIMAGSLTFLFSYLIVI